MQEKPLVLHERLLLEAHRGFAQTGDEGFSLLAQLCTQLEEIDVCAIFLQNTRKQCFSLQSFSNKSAYNLEQCVPQHLLSSEEAGLFPWAKLSSSPAQTEQEPLDMTKLCECWGIRSHLFSWVGPPSQRYGGIVLGSTTTQNIHSTSQHFLQELVQHMSPHFARHSLEQGIHEVNTLFAQTQEITQSGLWRLCLPSGRVFWTEEVYRIHGVDPRSYDSNVLSNLKFYSPESRALLEKALKRCAEEGTSFDLTLEFFTAQRKRLWVRARGACTLKEDDEIHITGTFQDIHEQKVAQDALQKNEERFRGYFEQGNIGITITNLQGHIKDANPYICKLLGYTHEEICGMSWKRLTHPKHLDLGTALFQKILTKQAKNFSGEIRLLSKKGEEIWIHGKIVSICDEKQDIDYILTYISEMTEQQKLELERRQLNEQMQHATQLESLAVLAGGIAHDFNNLLVGIIGNASLALLDLGEDDPTRATLEKIENAAHRAADLTRQMLAYAGHGRQFNESLSLPRLVMEMSQLLASSITKKAQLRCEIPESLPSIFGDRTQIQQIIMNLLLNASDALQEKGGTIQVRVGEETMSEERLRHAVLRSQETQGVFAYLEVSDDGCGMMPEVMQRIFDPFFTTKEQGHGLGLAAVLGIVRAHNGYLILLSEPQKGTSFRVGFPAEKKTSSTKHYTSSTQIPRGFKPQGNALVTDDESLVRDVVKRLLEHQGFQVYTANDGLEAIELYNKHKSLLDVFILDVNMPGLSGTEVLQKVREHDSELPVLLMSGYHEAGATLKEERRTAFLPKPFRGAQFFEKLKNLLGEGFQFFRKEEGGGKNSDGM